MERPLVIGLILVVYIVYMAVKRKETWKKLSITQNAGVIITFLGVIGIGGVILFYGVRFLIAFTSNDIIGIVIQFMTAIIVIVSGMTLFNKIVYKITNGVLPFERKRR